MSKRDKAFWSRLSDPERCFLVALDKAAKHPTRSGGHLPDDCNECAMCSCPMIRGSLCDVCGREHQRLIDTGNGKVGVRLEDG